jgi:hypothetical protein
MSSFEDEKSTCEEEENKPHWQTVLLDEKYEMWTEYPHPIRRKGTDKMCHERTDKDGYFKLYLSGKQEFKHKIIARQFLGIRPVGLQVDHIRVMTTTRHGDHNPSRYHLEILREGI